MSKQIDTCGNCIFFSKFHACEEYYNEKDSICPGIPKKPATPGPKPNNENNKD
jgi:hypothetical protein